MIDRGAILRPEYVKEHNVRCEKCGSPAHATHFDKDWDTHEYCEECHPKKEEQNEDR